MKTRRILYFSGVALILFVLLILSKVLYPPPPVSKQLSGILPDLPAFYLHCSGLQTRLKDFTQHEQYQRLLQTPYFQRMLRSEEGQAQLATFQGFLKDKLLSPMQFIGKELAFALYRNSNDDEALPAAVLLSRVSDKAKLAERVFYAFDWLTEIGVEKLPLKLHSHTVYQVQQADLLCPLYYTLVSDVAVVSSSLTLLESVITRISAEETEQKTDFLGAIVRHTPPESRFMTAFADPPALADEFSSNLFFNSFYITNKEGIEQMREAPPLFSMLDIYPGSIRLQAELSPSPEKRSEPSVAAAANSCWEESGQIRQFPLLLDIFPEALNALFREVQDIFPLQQGWQNPFSELRLWDSAIECRIVAEPVGKIYALPDLLCASDSPLTPEKSTAVIDNLLNGILEERVPPMLRNTMLRQERKPYQEVPVNNLQVMFQDVFSYAALANEVGDNFTILASNSAAVRQGIDKVLAKTDARPGYCTKSPRKKTNSGAGKGSVDEAMQPAAGLWLHPRPLARFLEDFSQTKSFELLFPRSKNPELYIQLPELQLILRSLPPMFLELGLQEEKPTAKLWSRGFYGDE